MARATRTPVSETFTADLARLTADPLEDVGVPGARFLGSAPERRAQPPDPTEVGAAGLVGGPAEGHAWGPDAPLRDVSMAIRTGAISAAMVVASARERIRAGDDEVSAWVCIDDRADQRAAALDRDLSGGRWHGSLHGIPVGIKDMIDVAGVPTKAGSRQWTGGGAERIPDRDAGVVTLLRHAGAIVLGKTRTHEFAFGGTTPPTRNPHDHSRIPGGSSGGSAAAVAAGHVRVAIGTDTCGSVRIPASYCGTVGLIPSVGLLPDDGVVPLAWSLDRVGLITATVGDLGAATDALGITATERRGQTDDDRLLSGLRIGVPTGTLDGPLDPAVAAAFGVVQSMLRAAGSDLVPVRIPHIGSAVPAGIVIYLAESLDFHRDRLAKRPGLFGADVRATLALAATVSGADYVHAQRTRQRLREEFQAALSEVDLLITPTMPSGAPEVAAARSGVLDIGGQRVGLADAHLRYNVIANLTATPAGTQPMGRDRHGMPLGVQWIGAPSGDSLLVAAMTALEARLLPDRGGRH